jgi:Protein of unknown function (DUF4244)
MLRLTTALLRLTAAVHALLVTRAHAWARRPRDRGRDHGQATAEYALVLVAAATIAVLLIAWASSSGRIGRLFNAVFDFLQSKVR